ncbi:MAG: 1-acyl-sn-glycerol-3-phosphate acyltransferase [Clostridia bacterium]|nr:1-acyl-sn-glycerol-3-phosphate acyltransferase [Clostridia bacterium]
MEDKKIIYYENELVDEFSSAKIEAITIDEGYPYFHHSFWEFCSFCIQNIFSMPIKYWYAKLKFHIQYVGREKLKECKNSGYFMYVNHTQEFADTFIPSLANYPKRNFFIVNPANVSMKGLKKLVPLLGAIPVPGSLKAARNFIDILKKRIQKKQSITIYPEAHIWPYYTKIRPFKDTSFKYPVEFGVPIFTITNTYHQGRKAGEVKMISYIDGPFYPSKNLTKKEAQKELRNKAYQTMTERSKESTYEHIVYVKKEGGKE